MGSSELRNSILLNDNWIYLAIRNVVLSGKMNVVTIFGVVYRMFDAILIHCYHKSRQGNVLTVVSLSHRFMATQRRGKGLGKLVNKRIVLSVRPMGTVR